jgi:hypothetical protein
MSTKSFYNCIKNAKIEREVEDVYNQGISLYFPDVEITHPYACDGLIETSVDHKLLKLILEYKYDESLKQRVAAAKVLIQILYYIKRFELNGLILPNVLMVGDVNECFVMHTNPLIKYLDEDLDWDIAPSKAHLCNPDMLLKIANDSEISYFVYDVNEDFHFKDVADKIKDLVKGTKRLIHITEHNIATIFNYFRDNVLKDSKKLKPNDLVGIFIGCLNDKDSYYRHPAKKGQLVTPFGNILIDSPSFDSFFSFFNRDYTAKEKRVFSSISDRLIEDTNRRNKGEFYTPILFVDHAHKLITKHFGDNWKDEYVVWDNSCGTKNLTRDYKFKELYCSTLEQAELEQSKQYNKEATSFVFDFLNGEFKDLPIKLQESIKAKKKMIVFMNPPYATAANGNADENSKAGVAKTKVNEQMLKDKIGKASQNLYAQFMYRVMQLQKLFGVEVNVCLFSKPLHLTGPAWASFRDSWLHEYRFIEGCIFCASHFANCSSKWGISFEIWKPGINENNNVFPHQLLEVINGGVEILNTKDIYNTDGIESASEWVKDRTKAKKIEYPQLKSGLNIQEGKCYGSWYDNSISYFLNDNNNIAKNAQSVALFTSAYSAGHGVQVTKTNFTRCTSLFTARRTITGNWVNDKDEYMAPNTQHPDYQEFENDALVYSLFDSASNQTSLRDIEWKGSSYDIPNEFFWLSKADIADLANENNNDDCYNQALVDNERYMYQVLQGRVLSDEAKDVLNTATELLKNSFKYRELFNDSNPKFQINNWDCGYYQLKALWKEYMPDEFKAFRAKVDKLKKKLIPKVYELGFLK